MGKSYRLEHAAIREFWVGAHCSTGYVVKAKHVKYIIRKWFLRKNMVYI